MATFFVLPLLMATCFASGCSSLQSAATERLKTAAADKAESKAIDIGVDLKERYDVDPTDSPREAFFKILRAEIKDHPDLAQALADVEKVESLQDALTIIRTYYQLVGDKERRAEIAEASEEVAKDTAKGFGLYGALASLGALLAFLRSKKFKQVAEGLKAAIGKVVVEVEKKRIEGGSAEDVVAALKTPKPGEESTAQVLASVVKEFVPTPTSIAKAQVAGQAK